MLLCIRLTNLNTMMGAAMSERASIADAKFVQGYNCAQAVFCSFSDRLGLPPDSTLKTACAFGAGMGRKGEVCGAVSGALMVLGLWFGRGEKEDRTATETTYAKAREFFMRFEAMHGTSRCRDLLDGCDLATTEGQQTFFNRDYFNAICRPCVRDAVEIVDFLIEG